MEPIAASFLVGFVVTTVISVATLLKLVELPLSVNRTRAVKILLLIIIASILFGGTYCDNIDAVMIAYAMLAQLLMMWAAAVTFILMLSLLERPAWTRSPRIVMLLHLPAGLLTIGVLASFAIPGQVSVHTHSGFVDVHFGVMAKAYAIIGAFYITSLVFVLMALLRREKALRPDLYAFLFITLVILFALAPLRAFDIPWLPTNAPVLFFQSLMGVAMAIALMRKSLIIIPRKEKPTGEKPKIAEKPLALGATYIYLGAERERAREVFRDLVLAGKEGLWITRKRPNEARKRYGLVKTPFIWLTTMSAEDEVCISADNTGRLSAALTSYIAAAKEFVILFEGIEYLHSTTGFQNTLRLCHFLNDKAMGHNGIIMLSVDPAAFSPTEMAMLASEAAEVFGEKTNRGTEGDPASKARRSGN